MSYFDYLEAKSVAEQKDIAFANSFNKIGLYFWLGSVGMTFVSILVFCFVQVGLIIWLDLLVLVGMGLSITSMSYASKVRAKAKKKHDKNVMANFLLVWGLLFVLINAIIILINTWLYFA